MNEDIPFRIQSNKNAKNIVIFPENHNGSTIVFTAHYDIVLGSSGANDNGSSVVILLKLAEYLTQTNHNISIVFLDREETGGYGCELFFRHYHPKLMVNLDVCGSGDDIVICDEVGLNNQYLPAFRNNMSPEIYESDGFPYCDGRHAERMGIDVWSISVFPHSDTINMSKCRMDKRTKNKVRNHDTDVNFGKYHASTPAIYKYMHRGKFDDINHINFPLMEKIYDYLVAVTDDIL